MVIYGYNRYTKFSNGGSRPFALQCEGRKAVTVNKKYPL